MNDYIKIKNVRIHNLKGVDVAIPKNKLTIITGVSGSGKSSLAFDTLYEEGKRRYLMFSGTHYIYKEWDVILLAKLLDHVCGDMYDFINDNLYKPLCIESDRWYKSTCGVYYSVALGDEGESEEKSNLTALSMLKIGQLFLSGGTFNGRQIISQSYISQAIAPSKCNSGYGFLWWRGENWYGCRGYGGQSITVVPEKNAIIVTQATPTSRGMGYDDVIWFCKDLM